MAKKQGTLPKTNKDTQNDGLEKITFLGCNCFFHPYKWSSGHPT